MFISHFIAEIQPRSNRPCVRPQLVLTTLNSNKEVPSYGEKYIADAEYLRILLCYIKFTRVLVEVKKQLESQQRQFSCKSRGLHCVYRQKDNCIQTESWWNHISWKTRTKLSMATIVFFSVYKQTVALQHTLQQTTHGGSTPVCPLWCFCSV